MVSGLSPPSVTGYPIPLYLDDWLICIPTLNQVVMYTDKVLAQIKYLGSTVNWKNSSLQPRQQVNFLRIHFDSVTMNAHLPSEGQQSGESIKTFPVRKTGECAQITEVVWLIAAASVVILLGLLRACDIQCWLFISSPSKKDKGVKLLVTQFCMKALLPWKHQWYLEHANVLELEAVSCLKGLLEFIHHKHVLVRTGSTSVVYHIIHQGGTKSLCCAVSRWLSSYWLGHGPVLHLWEQFTSQLWQDSGDILFRTGPLSGEWRLHP